MANFSCEACDSIRQTDPSLLINGITDTECASLQNNTGLLPSSGHEDEEDLHNLNDCLVGNMATEVDSFDVCDWKTFMKKFIPNLWTTLKAIICAISGLWTKVDCNTDSINSFDNEYVFSNNVTLLNGCTSANTPENPARLPTVTYGVMTGYEIVYISQTIADQLNNANLNVNLPNGTVDGYTVNGIPILKFTGNINDANLVDIFFGTQMETFGRFTYSIFPIPWDGQSIQNSVDADGNITLVLSLRSKTANVTYQAGDYLSFAWLQQVRRKLSFNC